MPIQLPPRRVFLSHASELRRFALLTPLKPMTLNDFRVQNVARDRLAQG
jgi:hypothetical protein